MILRKGGDARIRLPDRVLGIELHDQREIKDYKRRGEREKR
jgi:hypothetical protein